MLPVLLVLFAAYTLAVAYQARRALSTPDPAARQRQAMLLLGLTSLGIPLVVALIVVA
jgi:hypothetical protein